MEKRIYKPKTQATLSNYSLVFMIISVSSLLAFITLPHEMLSLVKGIFMMIMER